MRERATERVARPETADDLHLDRRNVDGCIVRERGRAVQPALHHDDVRAAAEQGTRAGRGVARSGRHLHLIHIANDDRGAPGRLDRPAPRIFAARPE